MPDEKTEIGQDKLAHGRAGLAIEAIERQRAHQGESPQGWAVVLRERPFGDIERPVRVEPRFAKNTIPGDVLKVVIVPHILQKKRSDVFPDIAAKPQKTGPVKTIERETERDKLLDTGKPPPREGSLGNHMPQGIDDERRIAQPMEEIVGVRVPGAKRGRGQHGSPRGPDRLPKPAPPPPPPGPLGPPPTPPAGLKSRAAPARS